MTFEDWWAKEFSNVNIKYENSSDALTKEWFNIVKRAFEDGKSATPSEDGGDEPKPFCWSYKMFGEQRFYPFDPRQADFGVNMAEFISEVEPLFSRAALSPAAVVMPEKKYPKDWNSPALGQANMDYIEGHNDALDEVARLNRRAIPLELLEIVRDTLEYWINRVDTRGMSKADYNSWLALGHHSKAMTALRALLGKEGE